MKELKHDSTAYEESLIRGVLPDNLMFNFPLNHEDVIVGADARYQVYFRVNSYLRTVT